MNFNNFNDALNQSHFMYRSQARGNKENQVYEQYDIHSHGHSAPKQFFSDSRQPQSYPSPSGRHSFGDLDAGPPSSSSEVFPYAAASRGGGDFYARAGPSHAFGGYEDSDSCVRGARDGNYVNRNYVRRGNYGGVAMEDTNPGPSMMETSFHAQEVPRVLDVPRAPGAPRPLTSGPGRPLFRPLQQDSIAPPGGPTHSTSVLGYGFFGLPSRAGPAPPPKPTAASAYGESPPPRAPAQSSSVLGYGFFGLPSRTPAPQPESTTAYGEGYPGSAPSAPASAPQGFAWPPMPVAGAASGARVALAPSASAPSTCAQTGMPAGSKAFTPKQAQSTKLRQTPTTVLGEHSKGKDPSASPSARRAANRSPPLRLLAGSVQRVTEWLQLSSQKHPLLFEVFGVLLSLSPPSAGQPRVLRLTDSASEKGRTLIALFYETDRPLAASLATGQAVRVVGRAFGRCRVQAFSARGVSAAEVALVRRLAFVSQRAVADLLVHPSEGVAAAADREPVKRN